MYLSHTGRARAGFVIMQYFTGFIALTGFIIITYSLMITKEVRRENQYFGEFFSSLMTTGNVSNYGREKMYPSQAYLLERKHRRDHRVRSQRKKPLVLILAYMRSGSTFLGELLKRGAREVHYSFEPFWGLYGSTLRRKYEVCHRNNTCVADHHSSSKITEVLRDIFSCKMSALPFDVLKSFVTFQFSSGYSKRCIVAFSEKFNIRKTSYSQARRKNCITYWERLCHEADARIVKTIRLSTSLVEDILSAIPDLKIIHLIRDPRAVINSRIKIGEIKVTNDSKRYFKHVCRTLDNDIGTSLQLISRRQVILPVSYESLTKNSFAVAKVLFKRLGLKYSKETITWLNKYSAVSRKKKKKNHGSYNINLGGSSKIASAWQTEMSPDLIGEINTECRDVLRILRETSYGQIMRTRS